MHLRTAVFNFRKHKDIFPINIVQNKYLSSDIYHAVFQYSILV